MTLTADLASIVGAENVSDDPEVLELYAKDYSYEQPRRPRCVAFGKSTAEVQQVVAYADARRIAITPRSSKVGFYGAGIPMQGGIILDLTRMNQIVEVSARDRFVRVEPGVTWGQLQEEVAKVGQMVASPLLPHPAKSALTSTMQREPMLIPKSEYSEVFMTAEMVLASGQIYHTGTAVAKGHVGRNAPEHFIPSNRLFIGAQGTLGIVTWATLKTEVLPSLDKLLFIPLPKVEAIAEPIYQIERRYLGNECFALNAADLAAIIAGDDPAEIAALTGVLPPVTVVICLSAGEYYPQEKIAYEEEALREVAATLHFPVQHSVGGIPGLDKTLLGLIRKPWTGSRYWKFRAKGGRHEVFFHTTLDRVGAFHEAFTSVASRHAYPATDIGLYVQPLERARAAFVQFGFAYCPGDAKDEARARDLHLEASELAINMGALFTTPYGPWADMVYRRAGNFPAVLKVVKEAFDPNNIMNPGKLCF